MPCEHFYDDREQLAQKLAAFIGARLRGAIETSDHATLVVSGGTSPATTFQRLREFGLRWDCVQVTLSDERWVPAEHPESNAGMVARELLTGPAAAAGFVGLYADAPTQADAMPAVLRGLGELRRPFDLVMLGMGADGHTASLFPDAPNIEELLTCEDLAAPVELPEPRTPRLTLTPAALLAARDVVLLFFGDEKRGVYDQALGAGPTEQLPVRVLLKQTRVPVHVFWAP